MVNLHNRVHAEMDNISAVLQELHKARKMPVKEVVVLAGIGAFLQNIYTGIENILKQTLSSKDIVIPSSGQWRKDLLWLSVKHKIISDNLSEKIGRYLFFRHFFTHSYTFLLNKDKIEPLSDGIDEVFAEFKTEIERYLGHNS
jgi:uncharacterized protein YutE (UPF0331/DUF86 family)